MIKIDNLSQAYGLTNVSCQIPQGKLVGIMGANGAGKSTLLKSIAGILPISSGDIWLGEHKLSAMTATQKSQQLAYLAQSTEIHWDLSVYEVITLGLPQTLAHAKEQEKVRSISETFSVTHLLDKPSLDPYYQIDIMEQLKSLTPTHTCVVAIHHLSLAYKFCDEVILLNKGKVIACGETQTVLNAENLAKALGVRVEVDREKQEIFGIEKLEKPLQR